MSISTTNFDASKIQFGEPRVAERVLVAKPDTLLIRQQKFYITPHQSLFAGGCNTIDSTPRRQALSYYLLCATRIKQVTAEHNEFLSVFAQMVKTCQEYGAEKKMKKANLEKMGSCLYFKEVTETPTLYAKVKYNEAKNKFFTRFQKAKVKKGEDKTINPLEVEGERCVALAVIEFESIYMSSSHATLQVKMKEVSLDFGAVVEKSFLPEPEEEEEDEAEW